MFEPLGKEPGGAGQDRSSLLIQLDDEICGERSIMESPRWERSGGFGSIDVWYAGKAGGAFCIAGVWDGWNGMIPR
ncbi:hypothetical protein VCV18_005130 [Metarhizium anisopliae]